MATQPLKRCPGFDPQGESAYRQEPHELPADLEHFHSSKGNRDGLSSRCKACGLAYSKAWSAAKKAGGGLSLRAERKAGATAPAASYPRPTLVAPAPQPVLESYADPLARAAREGTAPGYTAELVDGVYYALPDGGAAETEQGQVALQAVNEARKAARRKADAERKRRERAAAKAAAQA